MASDLVENTHYSIMFYGGRLLSHLTVDDNEVDDFISLCHLNRNPSILIDSDKRTAKQELNATKQRVSREFDAIEAHCWVTAGREIENYVDKSTLQRALGTLLGSDPAPRSPSRYQKAIPEGVDKIKLARIVTKDEAVLNVLDLKEKLEGLVQYIRSANHQTG